MAPGSAEFSEKEEEALGFMLDHMGHEVLTRSEAAPEKSIEDIVTESREATLDWLTSRVSAD